MAALGPRARPAAADLRRRWLSRAVRAAGRRPGQCARLAPPRARHAAPPPAVDPDAAQARAAANCAADPPRRARDHRAELSLVASIQRSEIEDRAPAFRSVQCRLRTTV